MAHIYTVDQMVDLVPAYNRPAGLCRIVQRVPDEGRGRRLQYRVQSLTEKNQRIVDEEDLRPSDAPDAVALAAAHFSPIPIARR